MLQFLPPIPSPNSCRVNECLLVFIPWYIQLCIHTNGASQESTCNAGDPSPIPWSGRLPWRRDRLRIPVFMGFPGGSDGKESTCKVGDMDSIPGLGRSPGGGLGNPLQYSCLENPHGQRSLEDYSPWCREKSEMTEWLSAGAAAAAKSRQSCPTLCDPTGGSPSGSSVPGTLEARILQWVAISFSNACMHAKLLQSCPTLCDPIDGSPPGSSVPGILQTRTLEWVAISFSRLSTAHTHKHG